MKKGNHPDINLSNYEEYLLLQLDGELNELEEAALKAFLEVHPALQEEAAEYESLRIPVEESLVFEPKELLYQVEQPLPFRKKAYPFIPIIWSAAAALAIWLGIKALPSGKPEQVPTPVVAEKKISQPPVEPETNHPEKLTSAALPLPAKKETVLAARPQKTNAVDTRKSPLPAPASAPEMMVVTEKHFIPVLEPLESTLSTGSMNAPEAPAFVSVPEYQPDQPTFPAFALQIPLLQEAGETAKERIRTIKAAGRDLRNTEATFVFANRELFTIRF